MKIAIFSFVTFVLASCSSHLGPGRAEAPSSSTAPAPDASPSAPETPGTPGLPHNAPTTPGDSGSAAAPTPVGPLKLRLLVYTGDSPDSRSLAFLERDGAAAEWKTTAVPLAATDARMTGEARIVKGGASTLIAYQAVFSPDQGAPTVSVGTASLHGGSMTAALPPTNSSLPPLAPGGLLSGGVGENSDVLVLGDAKTKIFQWHRDLGGQSPPLMRPILDAGEGARFEDAAAIDDGHGATHLVYSRGGSLFYRVLAAAGPGAEISLPDRPCKDIVSLRVAARPEHGAAAAYLCSRPDGCHAELMTNLGPHAVAQDLGLVAAQSQCLPFHTARPALVLAQDGSAVVAVRRQDDQHSGQWSVAYAFVTNGATTAPPLQDLDVWSESSGTPLLALDQNDAAHLVLRGAKGLIYALISASGPPALEPIDVQVTPAGGGAVLEPLDFTAEGKG